MGALLHWVNVELWAPMWPNMFSPNVWTLLGIAGHLLITLVQRERQHREAEAAATQRHADLKAHITQAGGPGDG